MDTPLELEGLLDRFPITKGRLDLIVEVGSTAHNISGGSDDLDLTAIWTERFVDLMQLDPAHSTKMLRTAPEGARSKPGDVDLQVYSMRKFVALCTKGNPSILNTLFVPGVVYERAPFPRAELAALSHTKSAGRSYLGFMDSQLKRWDEGKVAQRVNRPEEVEKYGFAVKFAAHAIRLGIQGSQFLTTGHVTIPMNESDASELRRLRRGEMSEIAARSWAQAVHEQLRIDLENSTLPEGPDRDRVLGFLADWHTSHMTGSPVT